LEGVLKVALGDAAVDAGEVVGGFGAEGWGLSMSWAVR
jgi:hypothetical protein